MPEDKTVVTNGEDFKSIDELINYEKERLALEADKRKKEYLELVEPYTITIVEDNGEEKSEISFDEMSLAQQNEAINAKNLSLSADAKVYILDEFLDKFKTTNEEKTESEEDPTLVTDTIYADNGGNDNYSIRVGNESVPSPKEMSPAEYTEIYSEALNKLMTQIENLSPEELRDRLTEIVNKSNLKAY